MGACYVADDRNITAYINKIRKKIEPEQSSPIYILTVWGVGYKFNEKIEGDLKWADSVTMKPKAE